jgi:hypothetical protein
MLPTGAIARQLLGAGSHTSRELNLLESPCPEVEVEVQCIYMGTHQLSPAFVLTSFLRLDFDPRP